MYSNVLLVVPIFPTYYQLLLRVIEHPLNNLMDSLTHAAAIIALVEAIAGIIFLTTPKVKLKVTPSIPY